MIGELRVTPLGALIVRFGDGGHLLFRLPSAGIRVALRVLLGEFPADPVRRAGYTERLVLRSPSVEELATSRELPDGLNTNEFYAVCRRAFG